MQNEDKTYYSRVIGSNSFSLGTTDYGPTVAERKVCNVSYPMTLGDHKSPNNFGFTIYRGKGGPSYFFDRSTSNTGRAKDVRWSRSDSYRLEGGLGQAPYRPIDWARTDDNAMSSIYDRIRGNSNVVVDILEGGQTLRMLKNATNVRKLVTEFTSSIVKRKSFRRTQGQKRLDYVTNKWLEYRYGWMPLVHSTYDALETLEKKVFGGLHPVAGRSSASDNGCKMSGSGSFGDPSVRIDYNLRYRTEVVVQFSLPSSKQIYDWTSVNPVGIAWELMPYSFVADWFTNIGDVLSSWENYAIFANRFVRGYRSRSYREDTRYSRFGVDPGQIPYWPGTNTTVDNQTYWRELGSSLEEYRLYLNREKLLSLPMPESGIRVQPKLNAKRLLDASALIHSAFKGSRKGLRI